MPERLRRLDSVLHRLPIYFVTTCVHERRPILNNADIHTRLVEFGETGGERGAWLGAYVLMPDHLHAFVVDDERLVLSAWAKSLKNALSENVASAGHSVATLAERLLRSCSSQRRLLFGKMGIRARQSVRAGLVKHWTDWPFLGEIFDLEYRDDPA